MHTLAFVYFVDAFCCIQVVRVYICVILGFLPGTPGFPTIQKRAEANWSYQIASRCE